VQLVNQNQQHVELADSSETICDLAEAATDLFRGVSFQLQHRHELAQTPRGDARSMQRRNIAFFERGQRTGQTIDRTSKEVGTIDGHDSRFGQGAFIIVKG
jgi:hypothetical protein